jgi:hypothetical protein
MDGLRACSAASGASHGESGPPPRSPAAESPLGRLRAQHVPTRANGIHLRRWGGVRAGSVKPPAQATLVRTQHLPPAGPRRPSPPVTALFSPPAGAASCPPGPIATEREGLDGWDRMFGCPPSQLFRRRPESRFGRRHEMTWRRTSGSRRIPRSGAISAVRRVRRPWQRYVRRLPLRDGAGTSWPLPRPIS